MNSVRFHECDEFDEFDELDELDELDEFDEIRWIRWNSRKSRELPTLMQNNEQFYTIMSNDPLQPNTNHQITLNMHWTRKNST